jgi:hypothetical protein
MAKPKKSGNTGRPASENTDDAKNPSTPLSTQITPEAKPTNCHCEISCKPEKDWWDRTKPWVEIFGAVVLALYTYYSAKMYCATKQSANAADKAANIAQSTLEVAYRPWMGITKPISVSSPLVFDSDGAHVRVIGFTTKNSGNSPAINASMQSEVVIRPPDATPHGPFDWINQDAVFRCSPELSRTMRKINFGVIILPGVEDSYRELRWDIKKQEIPNVAVVEVWVIGCIAYSDQFGKQHGTSFVYLYLADGKESRVAPSGTVPGTFELFDLSKVY